ncbi:MAG: hypothetical protein KGJ07_08065 [Patescibacteria group bacterium]|nr:hypothetical protein [Patescibacteria group bacterium]MDE2590690.1 hypothetical protein [Patescibacteria group bacterium]
MSSSKTGIVIFLVVLVVLVGGIFYLSSHKKGPSIATQTTTQTTQSVTPMPTSALPAGNSDAQLQQDSTQIDTGMNSFTNDTTAVDQGLSDQPGNLQ